MKKFKDIPAFKMLRHSLVLSTIEEFEQKGIDVKEHIKYEFSQKIAKEISDKLEIKKLNKQCVSPTNPQNFVRTVDYETTCLILANKEEIFNFLFSFSQLTPEQVEKTLKILSPSDEFYQNNMRQIKLEWILDENSPSIDNI